MITRWTIRIALGLCIFAIASSFGNRKPHEENRSAKWCWTLGLLFYLGHLISAFQFSYDWSHEKAYQDTALQTQEVIGWYWGGGLYVNYIFTIVWILVVVWWWTQSESRRSKHLWIDYSFFWFFAIIAINATIVFEQGIIRWFGLAACFFLGRLWLTKRSSVADS